MRMEVHQHRAARTLAPLVQSGKPNNTATSQVALLTGSGSGIGRHVALELARRGWSVAALDNNPQGLAELKGQMEKEARCFQCAVADVTDASAVARQVGRFCRQLGHIDLLIASAGIAGETPALAMQPD